jgi:hypothetical protein
MIHEVRHPNVPPQRAEAEEASERLAIVMRGQLLGFGALVLTLAAIVTLAAIGQPWVAGILATASLTSTVAMFVTGQYQPPHAPNSDAATRLPAGPPQQELPGTPPAAPATTE